MFTRKRLRLSRVLRHTLRTSGFPTITLVLLLAKVIGSQSLKMSGSTKRYSGCRSTPALSLPSGLVCGPFSSILTFGTYSSTSCSTSNTYGQKYKNCFDKGLKLIKLRCL
jgi:hypothetical protein